MAIDQARYKALLERASAMLAIDASPAAEAQVKEVLPQLAAELLLEWLVGDKRFESEGQQVEYWLSRFYEEIFVDEQPDATPIYQRFGLSLPRAAYLARLLRARRTAHWRQAARAELQAQLKRHKQEALDASAAGRAQTQEFDVSLSSGAADELKVVYDNIAASMQEEAERPRPPKSRASFGKSRWLGIPAATLLRVLDSLQGGEDK